ncbi:MAG: ABC transporter ATP-binding protein [Methanothrix sp.]|nr:ABC transporter ATP-binding protein [Methanothrix sp.]
MYTGLGIWTKVLGGLRLSLLFFARRSWLVAFALLLPLPAFLISMNMGTYPVSGIELTEIIVSRLMGHDLGLPAVYDTVVFNIRLPRILHHHTPRRAGLHLPSPGNSSRGLGMNAAEGIRVEEVCMAYGSSKILDGVSLAIGKGSVVTMVGPNGCGKTTLLKREDLERTEQALALTGISGLADQPYTQISGGERQLVMIARAMAQQPSVLLLDEPTSYLDFKNQILTLKMIKQISRSRKVTVIMTLHDPNHALMFSDEVVLLRKLNGSRAGNVIASGPPHEVMTPQNIKAAYGVKVEIGEVKGRKLLLPL